MESLGKPRRPQSQNDAQHVRPHEEARVCAVQKRVQDSYHQGKAKGKKSFD
tara:strand:+ start:1546 stop:1698 length:153 start_codon:yes stop_codon:yes gene_type:complete